MSTAAWVAVTSVAGAIAGVGVAYYVGRPKHAVTAPPGTTPKGAVEDGWSIRTAHDAGYPWNELVIHQSNWPTPGMFVDLGDHSGDWDPSKGLDSLVRALLGSALAMAGNDPSIAEAEGKDPKAAVGRTLRTAVRKSLTDPGGWNDRVYGQTNANFAGGIDPGKPCVQGSQGAPCTNGIRDPNVNAVRYMMNSEGRGLNWLPHHGNNLERLGQHMPAIRTTSLEGARLHGASDDAHQMLVWLPAFDLKELGPDQDPTISFLTWPDGSSTINPPPAVMALGIDMSGVKLPGLALGVSEGA